MKQSPIFVKTQNLMAWLIPRTLGFPKSQRGVLARRIQYTLFNFYERLVEASLSEESLLKLRQADMDLTKLRGYLNLARELQLLNLNQYEHAARLVNEVGRLLGGWRKTLEKLDY